MPPRILAAAKTKLMTRPSNATRAPVCRLPTGTFEVGCKVDVMAKDISAAVYETHGNPAEVLRVDKYPWPEPGPDEVVVRMVAAPVNPADLNAIEGKYPVRPTLPATPGFEGSGTVVELGRDAQAIEIGAQVILPHNIGTWREAIAVPATALVVVPREIDPVQAAMLKI